MLNEQHFDSILTQVKNQVFNGKGAERHGVNTPFEKQPWATITDNVGTGFVLGQAMKKLMELRVMKLHESWKREALGAIAYIIMAVMWEELKEKNKHE